MKNNSEKENEIKQTKWNSVQSLDKFSLSNLKLPIFKIDQTGNLLLLQSYIKY
jgi:hypothetical protein